MFVHDEKSIVPRVCFGDELLCYEREVSSYRGNLVEGHLQRASTVFFCSLRFLTPPPPYLHTSIGWQTPFLWMSTSAIRPPPPCDEFLKNLVESRRYRKLLTYEEEVQPMRTFVDVVSISSVTLTRFIAVNVLDQMVFFDYNIFPRRICLRSGCTMGR